MPLTPFDENSPPDNASVSGGAAAIRNLTLLIKNFLAVCFNMADGTLKASAVPNGVTTPYGVAGSVYTSSGPAGVPAWVVPGTLVTGMIAMYGLGAPPAGFLNCDGSTPLIVTYPTLAALLGTTYGGNGTTTFGLPDFRGRAPVGIGTGTAPGATAWTLNKQAGEETHTMTLAEMVAHDHSPLKGKYSIDINGGGPLANGFMVGNGSSFGNVDWPNSTTPSRGSGAAFNMLQPALGVNFIIKL